MNVGLPEISSDSFVQRTLFSNRRLGALAAEPPINDLAAHEVRTTLEKMSVKFAEAELDAQLSARGETIRRMHPKVVVLTSSSEDPELWRAVDKHRSRLEDGRTTFFILSSGAAESLQRNAPNLASLFGIIRARQPEPEFEATLSPLIQRAAQSRFTELYEVADHRVAMDLDEAIAGIINAFGNPLVEERAWRRLGFMGVAFLVEAMSTISGHWPQGYTHAAAILKTLEEWLTSSPLSPLSIPINFQGPSVPQAIAEALDVLRNAARLGERGYVQKAVAEIIDDCLQGYAIFPGSAGRRSLFDWWLHKVVPAAWILRCPSRFAQEPT